MDLRRLRYFVAVAEERSISRAARRLHVAQPPLSTQLHTLERELGVTLFTRHRRGVELTGAGTELVGYARRLLADVDAMTDAVRGIGAGGRLSLAYVPALATTLLPSVLRRLRSGVPDVVLDLLQADRDQVAQRVSGGRADAGLVYLPPGGVDDTLRDLEVAVVDRVPMAVFLPEAHPAGERFDLAALAGTPLLLPALTGRSALVECARAACRLAGVTPVERPVAGVASLVGLVSAGLGAGLLPANTPPLPGVAVVPVKQHVAPVETAVLWRRVEPPSPALDHFLRLALATPEPDVLGPDKARHAETGQDTR